MYSPQNAQCFLGGKMWESNVLGFLFLRASETVISILKYELSQAVVCARKLLNRQIPCGWHGAKKAG